MAKKKKDTNDAGYTAELEDELDKVWDMVAALLESLDEDDHEAFNKSLEALREWKMDTG